MIIDAESGIAFGVLYTKLQALQKRGALRKEALKWIKNKGDGYGSFEWCCEELGLRPSESRLHILSRRVTEIQEILKKFDLEKDEEFNGKDDIQDIE